jgi:mono/diheme cytochrome c family protein
MRWLFCGAAMLLVTIASVAGGTRAPERLSETGLYVEGRADLVAPENRPFAPQYPLWTDGAVKARWIYLPPGSSIDAANPNEWELPVGTRLWKEFAFNGRKVETRMIWRASNSEWIFATYRWNESQTDAILAPADGVPGAAEVAAGKLHNIPSVTDCAACHGTTRPGALGFTALQLSPDRDPNAIHGEPLGPGMITLQTLRDEGRLSGAPADMNDAPRIVTSNPRTRTALGYLLANCGGCHNGRGEIAALGPTLRIEELVQDGDAVAAAMVNQRTRWQIPGRTEGSVLIAPHAPEQSALLTRLRSRSPSSQMPPLGTVVRDTAAVQYLTEWVSHDLARQSHR